jgi:hypothetical protein
MENNNAAVAGSLVAMIIKRRSLQVLEKYMA